MVAAGPRERRRARLVGVGGYVPQRVMTNAELEEMVDTSDEWIVSRTGIRERRIAADDQATTDLAAEAVRDLLRRTGTDVSDVDLLIVATTTPDYPFPPCAPIVGTMTGMDHVAAYDTNAVCSGFMYGIAQATGMVESGMARRAVVVGAETLSRIMNWDDRATCVLFADGAGAVMIEADGGEPGTGVVGVEFGSDGTGFADLWVPAGGTRSPVSPQTPHADTCIQMNGREVFRFATRILVESSQRLLAEAGMTIADVDLMVAHQANERILDHASERMGIDRAKVVMNLDRLGNTSSASIPLALADAVDTGMLEEEALVLMVGFGAGLTWGSVLVRWEPRT
ncbi:MAG: beta-ketoacyl-ACP synthase III [Miltoncostaeaceae bacterium]